MNTCSTCNWRDRDGYCECPKIREALVADDIASRERPENKAALIYSYNEGGDFWVGPDFGCVHHQTKEPI